MPRARLSITVFWNSLVALCVGTAATVSAENEIDYSLQIEPILSDRCYKCHGPDENQRQAGLRLDIESEAKAYAIVPGDPENSELFLRVSSHDDDRMPPPESKLSLSEFEIGLIEDWIRQGAPWRPHWAFVPPPPVIELPDIDAQFEAWAQSPIDRFVLEKMLAMELRPSDSASREQLIRRATLDLTGLPPTLEAIDRFVRDDRPDAYERLLDRLLSSPAYGERMASIWLDIARYSDTYGYQVDRDRHVWPWRDWVVRAFNQNLPYDQFLTWQIAGDLLPGATDEQILATTFCRLHPQKVEGGSVPEEFRVEYVADRAQTFATAFLGLTMECARCHDHKYDPITQKEYYQLFAYFNNIDEAGLYSFFTNSVPTPTLPLVDEETRNKLAQLQREVRFAEQQVSELKSVQDASAELQSPSAIGVARTGTQGQLAYVNFEDVEPGGNQIVPGRNGNALKLSGDDEFHLQVGNFKRYEPFTIAAWILVPDVKQRAVVFHRSRAWTDAASRGYQLLLEDGKLSASLIHFWPGNAIRIRAQERLPTQQWVHIAMTYDGSSRADGLTLYVDGEKENVTVVRDRLTKQITGGGGDNLAIGARFRDKGFTGGLVDDVFVFDRQLLPGEISILYSDHQGKLTTDDKGEASPQSLEGNHDALQRAVDSLYEKRKALCEAQDALSEIMVMREMDPPRNSYLLKRGLYDQLGEPVMPGTPKAVSAPSHKTGSDRAALARWACDPDHPLTARVAVNHLWQMLFGKGIVRSPEDFGSQGIRPTHPQLLDWLARDLVSNGWDIKRSLKQIMLSATYQQSSTISLDAYQTDPENLWLSRFPRYRLPAEMIRDQSLAASGLLVDRTGGPPARPYEMAASFKPTAVDQGEGLYRRSLYTYWKRTGPAPVMMALDASKRDVCRVQRETTHSPMQALVIMNGPQFVEAARSLAFRAMTETGLGEPTSSATGTIQVMFRKLISRYPSDREMEILQNLYQRQLDHFADAQRVDAYLGVGEFKPPQDTNRRVLAALGVVANTIMNYDPCMMKR